MELNFNNILLKISNLTTVSSYIKGTLIFTLFTISKHRNDEVIIIGLYFIAAAVIVNILVLIASLSLIFITKSKEVKQKTWIAIGFQVANIPIAIAYFYFVINDFNTMP